MAKYTITYKCGHTAEIQLFGKIAERESKIEWYKTVDCPECKAAKNLVENQQSKYPTLEGSEKQISWAIEIRNKAAKNSKVKECYEKPLTVTEEQQKQLKAQLEQIPHIELKLAVALMFVSSAKWWIENRYL